MIPLNGISKKIIRFGMEAWQRGKPGAETENEPIAETENGTQA